MKKLLIVLLFSPALFVYGENIEIASKDIEGTVVYQDGETPVENLPIRIWSVEKEKMIYRSKTDLNGVFKIPKMLAGKNYIYIGRLKIDMKIFSAKSEAFMQNHDIIVALPRLYVVEMGQGVESAVIPTILTAPAIPTLLGAPMRSETEVKPPESVPEPRPEPPKPPEQPEKPTDPIPPIEPPVPPPVVSP